MIYPSDQVTKVCTGCGEDKPLSEYRKASSNADGLRKKCNDCENKYHLEYYHRVAKHRTKERKEQAKQLPDPDRIAPHNIKF